MTDLVENDKYIRLTERLEPDGTLVRVWPLKGGVSAEVTALEIALPEGDTRIFVVRQHGEVDRQFNPRIAATEYRLLQTVKAAGIPAPAPRYLDLSQTIFSLPYVVLEYIEGAPDFSPSDLSRYLCRFAAQLAQIHRIDSATRDLTFLPEQEQRHPALLRSRPSSPDDASTERTIRAALEGMSLPPLRDSTLLHGDYWPGNVLWREGKLVGIIDWEDAYVGDTIADLANSRLEILWAFGMEAMQEFTEHYHALTGRDHTHLPYWDLTAALRSIDQFAAWAGSSGHEKEMHDAHRRFVAQALAVSNQSS